MGIFQTLVHKYKSAKQKSLNKTEFKQALMQAVSDGKLTPDEMAELEKKKVELGLTEIDIAGMKAGAFAAAFLATKSDRQVTQEEEKELKAIQGYLGLADQQIAPTKKELERLRLLNEIQNGNLPVVRAPNLILQNGEQEHWIEPGALIEEKVVSRRYQGGSSGVSFRIMKGVSYRVGAHKGTLVSETDLVPVSHGDLVLTNKRIIFQGNGKSFGTKLDKVLNIQLFNNGLQFSETNKSKPKMVRFSRTGNDDIIGAILTYAINNYEKK
ncbi:MAG: hypothetical protein HYV02_00615 [Deltaproteobacteria bacterium]|nr:hypothetical protein [Deltaproteobacteria bacterium]